MRTFTGVLVMAALGASVGLAGCAEEGPPRMVTNCTVTKTDRALKDDDDGGGSDARVSTANCGVFKVADIHSGPYKRNNSADVFGIIVPGKTYDFEVIGERKPEWSEFPNILRATETSET